MLFLIVLITVDFNYVYNHLKLIFPNFSVIQFFYRPIILPEADDTNDTTVDIDDSEVTLEKIEEEMIAVIKKYFLVTIIRLKLVCFQWVDIFLFM